MSGCGCRWGATQTHEHVPETECAYHQQLRARADAKAPAPLQRGPNHLRVDLDQSVWLDKSAIWLGDQKLVPSLGVHGFDLRVRVGERPEITLYASVHGGLSIDAEAVLLNLREIADGDPVDEPAPGHHLDPERPGKP